MHVKSANPKTFDSIRRLARRWLAPLAVLAVMLAPLSAHAAKSSDDEDVKPDGRLEGYQGTVQAEGGTATTYLFLTLLIVITAGVSFMNAKRSHLD